MGTTIQDMPLILVAEDNTSNYFLFEVLLNKVYRILHAKNGLEAIQLFKTYSPQLILMDIKMPEMDGYEATREIRKISQTVPIIAITAYAFAKDEELILHSGFNAYLAKPVNANQLRQTIEKFLN